MLDTTNWCFYIHYGAIFSLLESLLLLLAIKKLNSIFDTASQIIQFMGNNKYIITKIKCWPVFKQDPKGTFLLFFQLFVSLLPNSLLRGSPPFNGAPTAVSLATK